MNKKKKPIVHKHCQKNLGLSPLKSMLKYEELRRLGFMISEAAVRKGKYLTSMICLFWVLRCRVILLKAIERVAIQV